MRPGKLFRPTIRSRASLDAIPVRSLDRWLARLSAAWMLILAQSFLGCALLSAQTQPAPASLPSHAQNQAPTPSRNQAPAPSHANLAAAQPAGQPASQSAAQPAQGAAATLDTPPPPDWPANDRPTDASVTWDSHGLSIVATNSSLSHILRQIATETGATLDGFSKDERVFGVYGPGSARDVISQLLDGTGYNVLMIGDQGEGTPRQIILTARSAGGVQQPGSNNSATSNDDDADNDQQPQQPEPQPPPQAVPQPPSGAAPPVPVRSQQQIIQELQQRQQQLQQQDQHQ